MSVSSRVSSGHGKHLAWQPGGRRQVVRRALVSQDNSNQSRRIEFLGGPGTARGALNGQEFAEQPICQTHRKALIRAIRVRELN